MKRYRVKNKSNKKIIITSTVLVAVLAVCAFLELSGKTSLVLDRSSNKTKSEEKAKTTSDAPTAQENFTGGDNREPTTQPSSGEEATVSDNRGNVGTPPPQTQWTTSPNGAIIVYSPARDTIITNGSTFTGKANSDTVSFRLIDNVSGVIAQGQISVVNGNFSGKFNFSTTASVGRLDIFNTKPDGVEMNNVEIPVRFR